MKNILEKLQKDAQSFLNNLSGKMPPALKKFFPAAQASDQKEEEVGEKTQPQNEVSDKTTKVNLKTMVTKLNEIKSEDLSEGNEEGASQEGEGKSQQPAAGSEEEKKQKRSKMIRMVVMGGIVLYVLSEIVFPPEEAPTEQASNPQQAEQGEQRPKKKKKNKQEGQGDATATTGTADTTVAPQENSQEIKPQEAPVETPVAPDATTAAPVSQPEQPVETVNVMPVVEEKAAETQPASTVTASPEPPVSTMTYGEGPATNTAGEAPISVMTTADTPESAGPIANTDLGSKLEKVVSENSKLEVPDYIRPPDYLEYGRGLVYNCSGKHWACVNKDKYTQCYKNQQWAEKSGKSKECITVNVYATNEDCQTIHIHNVNTFLKPDQCQ